MSSDSNDAMLSLGNQLFKFGKHKGKKFSEVRQIDSSYASWARKEPRDGQLAEFVEFCNAMDRDAAGGQTHTASSSRRASFSGSASDPSTPSKRAGDSGSPLEVNVTPAAKRRKTTDSASAPSAGQAQTFSNVCSKTDGVTADDLPVCEKCESTDLPFPNATRCGPCWRQHFRKAEQAFFLRVPREEKDEAKRRGAWWNPTLKKWYVPVGKDISLCDKWFVRCDKCGEGLSDHPDKKYDKAKQAVCQPECQVDRQKREDAERQEKERQEVAVLQNLRKEEADRRRNALKAQIKADFMQTLLEEAQKVEQMMATNNERSEESVLVFPKDLVDYATKRKMAISQATEGSEEQAKLLYNPFPKNENQKECLPPHVTRWLRSFGSKKFLEDSNCTAFTKCMDYQPITRIIDWALTFHHCYLDRWIQDSSAATGGTDLRFYVRPQLKLLSHLLLQALDPVTPDLKLLIEEQLQGLYGTTCPDIVGIFGNKILPSIRATIGDAEFARLAKKDKANWCVLEYMQNRKSYDKACNETEETTYMRDVLNAMIGELLGEGLGSSGRRESKGSLASDANGILAFEISDEATDVIYFANPNVPGAPPSAGARCFMLRNPNTKAADLFSLAIVDNAVCAMKGQSAENADLQSPSPSVLRQRIFALFRILHFRIARKMEEQRFARYGLDQGLREADRDSRMLKVKCEFPAFHDEMLQHHWSVRDFVGFEGKRLHSNTELINVLFTEHLELDSKKVTKAEKAARKYIDKLRKDAAAKNKRLKAELEATVKVRQLVNL